MRDCGDSVSGTHQVSEKHCGFVINRGNATAAQVCELMQEVVKKVKETSGVTLEPGSEKDRRVLGCVLLSLRECREQESLRL